MEKTTAATGEYRERLIARMAERAANITHWKGVRAAQIADGKTGDCSPDTITAGDLVKIRHHGWTPVLRTNKKTVSVETPAPFGGRLIRHTVPYPEIQDHRPRSETTDTTEEAATPDSRPDPSRAGGAGPVLRASNPKHRRALRAPAYELRQRCPGWRSQ